MVRDISDWLERLNLGQYAKAFAENDVDQDLLFELSDEDLVKLGIRSLGHRKRLFKEIAALKSALSTLPRTALAEPRPAAPYSTAEAERRQLTVMFCDLVGSTELSGRLDPEDLRGVLRRYQTAVTDAVSGYGGHVGQYLGDGVLVYFGWPQAYEDQAERAVHAGLHAIAKVRRIALDDGHLEARVGIASGPVVIGEFTDHAGNEVKAVTGRTPNLAARLQNLAAPGQAVIDAQTRRLVGTAFRLDSLGPHDLKGFAGPVTAWHVRGAGPASSRFEAAHAGRLSRFIGRERELSLLAERWTRARQGQGQAVLVAGDAGIGKSRLTQAFCDTIAGGRHLRLALQCSPLHANSAFYPVVGFLERAAGFAGDDGAARLDKLERLLRLSSPEVATDAALVASLLSLPGEDRYGTLDLSARQVRERTINGLIDRLVALGRRRPVLLVLEDAHWIDPTTAALIDRAMARIHDVPVLILITQRPQGAPGWTGRRHLTRLDLHRLPRDQGTALVRAAGGADLAERVVVELLARADGVPLFIEELTKSLVESNEETPEIPASLQASLVARLDRLGDAAKVAQLAALLGRSFHYRFIRAVSELDDSALDRALAAMTRSELLSQTGAPPGAVYAFKHALIQDAACETLLRSKRARYHGRIAEVLLRDFAGEPDAEPELVARHFSLAGRPDRAVEFWLRAGQRAGERSAHVEAIAHLENGLREVARLPQSRSRDEHELSIRVAIGASLGALKGWSSPEVDRNYQRALEISTSVKDMRKLLLALGGLANVYMLRGEIRKARGLADREVSIAQARDDQDLLRRGYRFVGLCSFLVGDFEEARVNLRRGAAMYDRSAHRAQGLVYSTDPAVLCLCISAWTNWFLGRFGAARRDIANALIMAEDLRHPFSLAYARSLAASVYQVFGEPDAVRRQAEAAIAIAEEHDFPYWLGWSTVMSGWAQSALGDAEGGIATLGQGLAHYERTGARQAKPYIQTLLAEMYGRAGLPNKGIDALECAYGVGNTTDVRFYESEALRIHGELHRQSGAGDGHAHLDRALALARKQGARALELRAAVSAVLASGDRGAASRSGLADLCRSLQDEDDSADLRNARRLLDAPQCA